MFEAERSFVVDDQSGRDGLAGVGIGEAVYQPQSVDHAPGRGELDPCDCVVPVLFRRSMPGTRALRGGRQRRRLAESCRLCLVFAEASFPTLFGPVGGAANPGMFCLTGSGRCLWQSARSGSLLQPWSAVPSTVRFSGSAYRGPGLAMALRRVLVVAAVFRRRPRWFHGVPGPFTSRRSRARACRRRQVRFGKVKQFAEPSRPAFSRWSGLPRGL